MVRDIGLRFDPEIAQALAAMVAAFGPLPQTPAGDWQSLRALVNGTMAMARSGAPEFPDLTRTDYAMQSDAGPLRLRWFAKQGAACRAAVLYIHGGGMICGSIDLYDSIIAQYVAKSGIPMLAVGYRLAPEHPHPAPLDDCLAALRWLLTESDRLGVDPARIAVMGDSAGGGLAAGTAQMARDAGIALKQQILIYPMLDDRSIVPDPAREAFATWSADNNATGWRALLGGCPGFAPAAPARAERLEALAPAYIEVGELDLFCSENISYAQRLVGAHVPVELHLRPGAPHAFERIAPDANVSLRAMADRIRVLQNL